MPKVYFTYDQHVTQTFRASCDLPEGAESWSDGEVQQYLAENHCDWEDDTGEDLNTEYGDHCGPDTITIEEVE